MNRIVVSTIAVLAICPLGRLVKAEKPAKLSQQEIQELTQAGDRLADQADYLGALQKYTQAYLGVVSGIRGQDFTNDVQPKVFNREDLGEEMKSQFDNEYTEDELLLMDCSFQVLGLAPPDLKSKELMTQLLTEEVAGFYDPDNKRMVLIVDDAGNQEEPSWLGRLLGARPIFDKDEQKTTLAHELTHALQDQLYDLNAMQEGIEDDDDMLLAFSALVEGDATLLMFVEADDGTKLEDMDPAAMRATFNLMSWMMPMAGGDSFRKAPPIFRESLIFPYMQGMLFAMSIGGNGGWKAIHKAYQNPPSSTEQILHPNKYLNSEELDAPTSVSIPDLRKMLGKQWNHLGGNCLGELQTSIMLKRIRGGSRAAAGWDGDRYEVFRKKTGELALAMATVWDSEKDAIEFEQAYRSYREANPNGSNANFLKNAERLILREADKVFVVEGLPKRKSERILRQLKLAEFSEKSFPVPARTVAQDNTKSKEAKLTSELKPGSSGR